MAVNSKKNLSSYFNRDIMAAFLALLPAALLYYVSFSLPVIASFTLFWQFAIPASVLFLTVTVGYEHLKNFFSNVTNSLHNIWKSLRGQKTLPVQIFDMSLLVTLSVTSSVIYGLILGPAAPLVLYIAPIITLGALKLSKYFKDYVDTLQKKQTEAKITYLKKIHNLVGSQPMEQNEIRVITKNQIIPADAELLSASAEIQDPGIVSGEANHLSKKKAGDYLYQGTTYIGDAPIQVKARFATSNSGLNGYMNSLSSPATDSHKTTTSKFLQQIFSIFIPAILLVAAASLLFWGFFSGWTIGLNVMMDVLFSACPCALLIAKDMPFTILKNMLFSNKIIVRKHSMIEKLAHLSPKDTALVFDLTNTLTELNFIETHGIADGFEQNKAEILSHVLALERARVASNELRGDPHAKALIAGLANQCRAIAKSDIILDNSELPDHNGIIGSVAGKRYFIGDYRFLENNGFKDFTAEKINTLRAANPEQTNFVFIATEHDGVKQTLGYVKLQHKIKPDAKESIKNLQALGFKTRILTGSSHSVASKFAKELGITEFDADLTPEGKAKIICQLKNKSKQVIMIGDGINDIAAAQEAHGSIAIGVDSSMNACFDISLPNIKDIMKIMPAARKTLFNQKILMLLVISYIAISIVVAAIVLPITGTAMMMGCFGICMAFSSLLAVVYGYTLVPNLKTIFKSSIPDEKLPEVEIPNLAEKVSNEKGSYEFTCNYNAASCCNKMYQTFMQQLSDELKISDITHSSVSRNFTIRFTMHSIDPQKIEAIVKRIICGMEDLKISRVRLAEPEVKLPETKTSDIELPETRSSDTESSGDKTSAPIAVKNTVRIQALRSGINQSTEPSAFHSFIPKAL